MLSLLSKEERAKKMKMSQIHGYPAEPASMSYDQALTTIWLRLGGV
jgi:hypothetical protein